MPSEFDSVAQIASFLSNALSVGEFIESGIVSIFGLGSDMTSQKLTDMTIDEVNQVFIRDLERDKIADAAAAEETAGQYLGMDYHNAVTQHTADSDLYADLAVVPGPPYLQSLETQVNLMAGWTASGESDLAQQTISLYLTLALTVISFYQERARRATDPKIRKSDHDTTSQRAQQYHDQAAALVADVDKNRRVAVSSIGRIGGGFVGGGNNSFTDSWMPGDTGKFYVTLRLTETSPGPDDTVAVIVPIYDNYMSLLATGDEATVDAIRYLAFGAASGLDDALKAAAAYGTWLSACTASLANLLRVAADPLGSPTPQTTADKVFVFARDTQNGPSFIRQSSTGKFGWSDWAPLGGTIDQLAAIRNTDGRVEVFGRGTDRCLYHMWQLDAADATWSPWISLGGSVSSFTVAQNGNGSLEVFSLDANGVLSHAWQGANTSTGWSDWTSLGGVSSSIAVGRNDDGRLEVFGIGTDNGVYYTSQGASTETGWSAWSSLGGWSDMLAVAENAFGRIEVFARGSDKALYHIWQDWPAVGRWSQWARLGNTIDLFAVGTNPDGRLEVFARGTDRALYHIWQDAAATGGWSEWGQLGGDIDMLATARNADGRIEVFARGEGNVLYHMWQDKSSNNGWSAWTSLGGSIDLLAVPAYVRPVSPSGGANKWR